MPRIVSGFEVGTYTPEQVLRARGLDARASVEQLVAAAAPHDDANPGYLSKAELEKGADDLAQSLAGAPTTVTTTTARYARKSLADVKAEILSGVPGVTYSDEQVLAAADLWDDGNGYLKKDALRAGAYALQMTAASGAALKAGDIAAIRGWTGCERKVAPVEPASFVELGVVSDIDKTLMPPTSAANPAPDAYPGVARLITLLETGPDGTGALGDVTYVTARNTGRVADMPAWLARNHLPAGTIETGTSSLPWIAEDEKVADITRVLNANPGKKYVLFGDTNHRDPEVYTRIRAAFPDAITATILHDVKTIDAARTDGATLVANYAEAAAALVKIGVLDATSARLVMTTARDEGLAITDAEIDALLA